MSRVLIVENTARCVEQNPTAAVLLPDFRGVGGDTALSALAVLLRGLLCSGMPVPRFLHDSPLVEPCAVRARPRGRPFTTRALRGYLPDDRVGGPARRGKRGLLRCLFAHE